MVGIGYGRSVTNFDQYGDSYAEQLERAIGRFGDPELFTKVKAEVLIRTATRLLGAPSDLSVLDIGCGPGLTDTFLTGRFGSVAGVDTSPKMIARARVVNPTVRYDLYDGERLPFEGGAFDLTFAINVLHHVELAHRWAFVTEAVRVTRVGGVFAVLEHNPLNPLTRIVVSRCEFDEDVDLLRMQQTTGLLVSAGARPVASSYIAFFPWDAPVFRRAERILRFVPLGAQYIVAGQRQ